VQGIGAAFARERIRLRRAQVFSDTPVCRSSDCRVRVLAGILGDMTSLSEVTLAEKYKLEALQRLDQFRKWRSLEDKRYCICCGTMIDGWRIRVIEGSRLLCPTEGCQSIPMDWVLPTDEMLATMSILSVRSDVARRPTGRESNHIDSVTSRIRDVASPKKRSTGRQYRSVGP
jgi:hypothetical protein